MCHIIFAHNDRCGYPLHTLLGKVVHGLGGADEFIRIMNTLGMVSSSSKIRDYELDFMYAKMKYGPTDIFTDGAFCFASVDNVDKSTPMQPLRLLVHKGGYTLQVVRLWNQNLQA